MKRLHSCIQLLGLLVVSFFGQNASAQPVYVNDYLLQGEAFGSVLNIEPSVRVRSEKTVVEVRNWLPTLQNPVLQATTEYEIEAGQPELLSLFTLNATKEPRVTLNGSRVRPSIAQFPIEKVFYDNSFRLVDTKDNPVGALLSKSELMGYAIFKQKLDMGANILTLEQGFDVRVDSHKFLKQYKLFLLNPQWQGQMTGLIRAWEVTTEILVPPSWTVRSETLFERSGDVVSFQLDPSQAVLEVELIPPHNARVYKLVKSSLWLLLMVMIAITALIGYAAGHFVERTKIPPRVMMLMVVVLCMGIDWVLANQLTDYLQTEAFLHHLSLRTVHTIQYNHWVHLFYGSILTALVACLVFLRSLGIDFFHEYEVDIEEDQLEVKESEADTVLEEEIAPPEFTLMGGEYQESEASEGAQAFTLFGPLDDTQMEGDE